MHAHRPDGLFPAEARFETHTEDAFRRFAWRPIFLTADWISGRLRWVQHGRNQLYILYIAATLVALLVWKLRGAR